MLIKLKARGYSRKKESFVTKDLLSCSLDDQEEVKELRKEFWKLAMAEAKHNRSTMFRLMIVSDDDDDETIDFDSSPKKKSKQVDDDDDDDDELSSRLHQPYKRRALSGSS